MPKVEDKLELKISGANHHSLEGFFDPALTLKEVLDDFNCAGSGQDHRPHNCGGDAYATGAGSSTPQLDPGMKVSELPQQITLR